MADANAGVEIPSDTNNASDDVFVNGNSDNGRNSALLHPDICTLPEQVIPRRSSLVKDMNRRGQGTHKKTVSFSSMPNEKIVVNASDCLSYMQGGSDLVKVRSNSRQYQRLFSIDADLKELRWQPSSKKPHKARILIDQIKEVYAGKNTAVLRQRDYAGCYPNDCAFSIVYGENFQTMDLIANSPDEAIIWVTGLTCLISGSRTKGVQDSMEDRQQMRDRWLAEVFQSGELDDGGRIADLEVVKLMKKLNNGLATVKIQQKLKELALNTDGQRGRLTSSEFINLFKEISTRPEIYFLLVRYASSADFMTTDDLLLFLETEQGMTRVTKDQCLEIIDRFEPSKEGRHLGHLGIDGFTAYLLSNECDIFDVEHKTVCQAMGNPLSHYFIASSHNTYLLEDQLRGPSSIDGYKRALRKGCRCVELDCWDGPNDEPIVYHGRTLTSKILFKSVIDAIHEVAFEVSEYPVILSLENHCSIKQQQAMTHYMKEVFGDNLHSEPNDENRNCLPSPESLRRCILIKNKKLSSDLDETEGYVTDEDESAETDRTRKSSKKDSGLKKQKLSRELSDLVTYCRSVRFKDFQSAQQDQRYCELCSLSESGALKLASSCPEEFVNHNKRFLSRVYPNGMRVDSSNYNPQDLWNCGCQLVALNYQTPGLMMDLYDGRFLQNGRCGYVLKPVIMRDEIAYFSANTREVIPGVSPQILHIKIISGQQFCKPKGSGAKGNTIDPYVTVEIFGIPSDCAEERTKTVQHNGYNPLFDESFEFQVNLPELALVRIAVLDDDFIGDEFIGQYTLPFECMQTGYRHICLKSNTGEEIANCTLFLHVAMTNKRGGGKFSRRGVSMRRGGRRSDYTSLKSTGMRAVDETFKVATQPLRDAADLRSGVAEAEAGLTATCGLAPFANMKQCVRTLSTRVSNSAVDNASLRMYVRAEYPCLEAQGQLPDVLKKALVAFELLVVECRSMIDGGEHVYEQLIHAQQAGMEWHEDLQNLAQQSGLKGKKLNKAVENFTWNIRVLKGQADLIRHARQECLEHMQQVQEAGISLGLLKDSTVTTETQVAPPASSKTVAASVDLTNSGSDQ